MPNSTPRNSPDEKVAQRVAEIFGISIHEATTCMKTRPVKNSFLLARIRLSVAWEELARAIREAIGR